MTTNNLKTGEELETSCTYFIFQTIDTIQHNICITFPFCCQI
jgi:hypothetical protein